MKRIKIRWLLVLYDFFVLAFVDFLLLFVYSNGTLALNEALIQFAITFLSVFSLRILCDVYKQIWRYGGIQCYIRLLWVDALAFVLNFLLLIVLPVKRFSFTLHLSIACISLLCTLAMRMLYRYAYKCGNNITLVGKLLNLLLFVFAGIRAEEHKKEEHAEKLKLAIIGAGRLGVVLAEELIGNEASPYAPVCFIDTDKTKIGKRIHGLVVFLEDEAVFGRLKDLDVANVVITINGIDKTDKKRLYDLYVNNGFNVKIYDYPIMQSSVQKRNLRSFDVEELLFRSSINVMNDRVFAYYKDKVILVTGGGGSIGSEICRQLAKMSPKKIIILDIYENGAYDVQQELRIGYGNKLDIQIEITSITNRRAMAKVFATYHPDILINAAAHKHVPLMEHNCIEAVENNVFGTKLLAELCEEYHVKRFMMVSTDKAVNPTNVMGATKRMCEMIVQSASKYGSVKYSCTRFGNVLGSAGSVIPLFRKQIANGGPITITHKDITRYFMTIPEASSLVLESGAYADNGELFVLDMGQPIRIYNLAENMIRLAGAQGIDIVEIGLRPGEKLYEELLIETEKLEKTDNNLIFIEKDTPLSNTEIDEKLELLHKACDTGDDDIVREVLKKVVPTFKAPEEVNNGVKNSKEAKNQKETVAV